MYLKDYPFFVFSPLPFDVKMCGDRGEGSVGRSKAISPVVSLKVIAYVFGISINVVFISQDVLL